MKNKSNYSKVRAGKILAFVAVLLIAAVISTKVCSQCEPIIYVDSKANEVSGLTLPVWLNAGQILSMNGAVNSVSVIEFTENGASLEYSHVLSISSQSTVPAGKVWKIESILKLPLKGNLLNTLTFTSSGSFIVPTCTNYICVEVWGGGGGGGGAYSTSSQCNTCAFAGGGGGGGYGSGCITVTPGSTIPVTVGAAGARGYNGSNGSAGGTSSVGSVSATGGGGGMGATGSGTGAGGSGGTSSAFVNITGGNGVAGIAAGPSGNGGAGANGGAGGSGNGCNGDGTAGTFIGGGGGGAASGASNPRYGGNGAAGQVKISW